MDAGPEVQQRPEHVVRDDQSLAQIAAGRLAEHDVDPEEALALAQSRNPLPLGRAKPLDDLAHAARLGSAQDGFC